MNILCITDQNADSDHSSIKGIFGGYLRQFCPVTVVYFSKEATTPYIDGSDIVLPYKKRKNLFETIDRLTNGASFDVVIVRNFITLLWQALRVRPRYGFRLGFWHSFPHSYRRYFQAKLENKSIFRKALEYRLRSILENKLVSRCDFLISMSREFKEIYYHETDVRFLPLPMGVDFRNLSTDSKSNKGVYRILYTGTVDKLRQTDVIMKALTGVDELFELDIFTSSCNETTDFIKSLDDPRVRVLKPLPRASLLSRIFEYDLGIGAIPENELYIVSSPTKTIEYYALGVPAIVTYLPEYLALFDDTTAFFCHFTIDEIRKAFLAALNTPRLQLQAMGKKGRVIIQEKRNYEKLARDVYTFLTD
jgi:glycosyltransferase involved in cell wall biosynthesis